jgi:hypothetical protein
VAQVTGEKVPDPGIFITKGMRVSIPKFSIQVSPDGKIISAPITLHTGIDLCPTWLDIAHEQLLVAELASADLLKAKDAQDNEGIAKALSKESCTGMQVIMASSVAMDAYYANLKEYIAIPQSLSSRWREKGTARYKQIAEVIRRASPMNAQSAKQLRDILRQNTDFRDKAVHPLAGTTAPALHAELNKVTDWRYAAFRFYNAKAIAGLTLSIIIQTARKPNERRFPALAEYCKKLVAELAPRLSRWESRYGKLF